MSKFWTTLEVATLAELYPVGGSKAVNAALPHRSRGTIKVRAHALGIRRNRSAVVWSAAEDAAIAEHYPTKGAKFVARLLERDHGDVMRRARKLGVRRMNLWTKEQDDMLRAVCPARNSELALLDIPNRTRYSIRNRVVLLGLTRVKMEGVAA